jgi:hypothetical protein
MDLYAKFVTRFREEVLTVELTAHTSGEGAVQLEVTFEKDDRPYRVENLTRRELAALCREAATLSAEQAEGKSI